jgi:peptidoglycan/xylan/chitin deacetylase (PgdA/CDA1 family)
VSAVLVLAYHAVSRDWTADLSLTPERLTSQLELLVRRGYRGVTFHDAVHGAPSGRAVAVTFDDAYRSVLELAMPIMSRLGFVGTVFAPTDYVGSRAVWPGIDHWVGGAHDRELHTMSWTDLRMLADAGWEIGSHTCSHPHLTRLADAGLAAELASSRRCCEEMLQRPCRSLAYPYGDHDARVVRATQAAGYDAAATLPEQVASPDPLRWPRVGVYYLDTGWRFRMKVSPIVRRVRASPAWPVAVRRLRQLRR